MPFTPMGRSLALLSLGLLLSGPVQGQDWQLVWSDEFDYTGSPDPSKWSFQTGGGGWGNQEIQFYTDRTQNARADGSNLIIEARAEPFNGASYTSARLRTKGKAAFRYGRFEIRAQLPSGIGTWPAIWMLSESNVYGSWPQTGEIDIMEHVGKDQGSVHASLHMGALNHTMGNNPTGGVRLADASTAFHVYALEWTPRRIEFYVDDQLVDVRTPGFPYVGGYTDPGQGFEYWPFDQEFHFLLNIAVGGSWGGPDVDPTAFPTQMLVDYVRVYENAGTLPQVDLSVSGTALSPGDQLVLESGASDPDGSLETLTFYQGPVPLGVFREPPYHLELDGVQEGCYTLAAEAVDTEGWSSRTEGVALTVGSVCARGPVTIIPQAIPGTLELENYDSGGNGVAYRELDDVNLGGQYRPNESVDIGRRVDGSSYFIGWLGAREWTEYTVNIKEGVYRVDAEVRGDGRFALEIGGQSLLEMEFGANTSWRQVSASDVDLPGGQHILRFQPGSSGFDIDRLVFTETGAVPSVELVSPSAGSTFSAGSEVLLSATAVDRDGDLAGVTFFQGIAPIAAVSSAPFERTLSQVPAGCYSVSAEALDARGNRSRTEPVQVRVGDGCVGAPYLMRPAPIPGLLRAAWFDLVDGFSDLDAGGGGIRPENVDLAEDSAEGHFVTNIAAREFVSYTVNVAKSGDYMVTARVRSFTGGAFELQENGTAVSPRLALSATGGNWVNQSFGPITLTEGVRRITVQMRTGGFDLVSLRFADATNLSTPTIPEGGFRLGSVFPNPALTGGFMPLTLDGAEHVQVNLYDIFGRLVAKGARQLFASGEHRLTIPSGDLASGVYLISVQVGARRETRSITVIR